MKQAVNISQSQAAAKPKEKGKDKQRLSLTRSYMGALSLVAVLTVAGHLLTSYVTNTQRENAEITYTMTVLRSLVDVVVSQSSIYKASGNAFDFDMLTQSLQKLKREYKNVKTHKDDALAGVFEEAPFLLKNKIESFLETADMYAATRDKPVNEDELEKLVTALGKSSRLLEINLDLSLEEQQAAIIEQGAQSYKLQFLSVLTVLLVLLLEAFFIFHPLVLRLDEYHKDLLRLALSDALTGLNNRRAFMQQANARMDYSSRHKTPFALVMADLDKFKSVNDTYGHKVGDLILQHYSGLLQQSFRKNDIIGRIGGEEFAIFLPETGAQEALLIIERFRKAVQDTPCSYVDKSGKAQTLSYTASFGVVAVSVGVWTMDNLFIIADENLYKAKDKGRNCVIMHELTETGMAKEPSPPSPPPAAQ